MMHEIVCALMNKSACENFLQKKGETQMVRNNKRRAFTIVELVIVIAVIAILAAVMIPTFGGIIKRANISADTQIAASMNTQLSIYKAEGKKIETEADLWAALKSDADFTSQLDPKSAKHGYHFWYDVEKNEIKLLANADVLNTETQAVLNADPEGNVATPFAQAAPRLVKDGFYLLDKVADDKSTNDIALFFDVIEKMGEKTKADYQKAITDLTALVGDGGADEVHHHKSRKESKAKTYVEEYGCAHLDEFVEV
jgi:prepilin-type N-terminal cleavage/methylation domain-containing protein